MLQYSTAIPVFLEVVLSGRSEISQKQVVPQKKPQWSFSKKPHCLCHINCSPPEVLCRACSVCTATRHASKNLKHLFSSCLCASTNLQDQVETVTYSRSIQQELHLREHNSSYGRGKSDNSEDAVSLCGNKNVFHSIWDVI